MAIARDTSAYLGAITPGTATLTASYTVTGSDVTLWLYFSAYVDGTNEVISSVTWNGSPMTLVQSVQVTGSNGHDYLYKISPAAAGTHNIVITPSSSSYYVTAHAASYTGTDTATDASASSSANHAATVPHSQALTVVAANCWKIWGVRNAIADAGDTYTLTGSPNQLHHDNNQFLFDSNGTVSTGSGTYTIANDVHSADWGSVIASFGEPASGSVVPVIMRHYRQRHT